MSLLFNEPATDAYFWYHRGGRLSPPVLAVIWVGLTFMFKNRNIASEAGLFNI
jgi:hypothetical protein